MRHVLSIAVLLFSSSLAAEPRVFGGEMPEGESIGIAQALAGEALPAGPAKFHGRITQVCQNKGCWLILEDDGQSARVMTRGHSWFVPKDSSGRAVVFGEIAAIELKPEMAQHLAEDAGETEPVPTREFRITADAVALLD